jgi:RHS repeat-associated protein
VTYTYGAGGTLATKTDARNQQIRYTYDSYLRLTRMAYYQTLTSAEDTQARVDIYYDTAYSGPSTNMLGRVTWKQYTAGQGAYTFRELYGYRQPGQLSSRTLQIQYGSYSASLAQSWTYDNEGRVTFVVYPAAGLNQDGSNSRAQSYSYGYDVMGRLSTMQSTLAPNWPTNVVRGTTFGPAGELLTISFAGRPSETSTYNSLLQLTSLNEWTFTYPAGENNGRILNETNTITGEQVTYQYDELNRLMSAYTTDNPNVTQWGQSFVYDGFGNLREKNVFKGSATLSVLVDAATNRLPLYQYDTNGNQLTTNTQTLTYNYENRLSQATTASNAWTKYTYDPDGRRVYAKDLLNTTTTERVYIYGLGSELMATYILKMSGSSVYTVLESHRGYFGSRLTEQGTNNSGVYAVTAVTPNRLGGVGKNYPYGETGGTGAIFATYTRDSGGLDYAVNRYYYSTTGRFTAPDPYRAGDGGYGLPADPRSWNRYAYVEGDPVNFNDPQGLLRCGDIPGEHGGILTGRTFEDILDTGTDYGLLAVTIFVESARKASSQGFAEMAAIGAVIMNRFNIVNGYTQMTRSNGAVQSAPRGWGKADNTLSSIIINPTQFEVWQGQGGTLTDAAQSGLDHAFDSDAYSAECYALETAYQTALDDLVYKGTRVLLKDQKAGLAFTGFNSFNYTQKYDWEQYIGQFGSGNKFYGVPMPIPVMRNISRPIHRPIPPGHRRLVG